MKTTHLSVMGCVLILMLTIAPKDSQAKFKPFACAKEVVGCIKSIGSGVKLLKAAKKACGNFKGCKKTCKAEKKACKKEYRQSKAALKSAGMDEWVQNLCKKGKLDCKDMCKFTYMTPECIAARSAVSDWVLSNKGSKSKSIGRCVKALDVCIPSNITSCMAGVYMLAAENKSSVQQHAAMIKKQCGEMNLCTRNCLFMPSKKSTRKCVKACKKNDGGKKCKNVRRSLAKLVKSQFKGEKRKAWSTAIKACSF